MTGPTDKPMKNFSIRLNSEGLCFICLRDAKANGGDHAPPTSFRLRNIARFLGIDTKQILKAYLDYDLKRCSDVKVELCEGCSEQIRKFNCLYQTLELTKLKLNECAQKISSLIKEAEQECDDDDRTGEMERRVTHAATRGVIVDLRAGISEKCLAFSESLPPRLILKRLPESELTKYLRRKRVATGLDSHPTPIKIEVSGEDDECRSFIDDNDAAVSEMGDSDTESVIAQEQRKTETVCDSKAVSKSCRRGGRLWCPFCKAVFLGEQRLHLHLVNYHLQPFFFPEEEHKEPSLTSHQFIQIVHHLLFKNIFTENPVTEFVSRCPHCSKTFHKDRPGIFRIHLLKNHKVPLIQRLKALQTVPRSIKLLSKIKTEWLCKCGVYCSNMRLYAFHRSKLCNLIGKSERDKEMTPAISKSLLEIEHQQIKFSKSADGTLRASCPYCRDVVATKRLCHLKQHLESHLIAFHLHTFFNEEDLKEPSLSSCQFQQVIHHHLFANISTDPENMNLFKCPDCSATMPKERISRLKMHVIKFHHELMVQRLKDLQKNSTILNQLSKISEEYFCNCGAYCSTAQRYKFHRSKFCKLVEKTPTNAEMTPKLSNYSSEAVYQQIKPSIISKSVDGTEQLSCPHCRAVITTKLVRQVHRIFRQHLVCHHLHTFFPEDKHKVPSLSSLQFKQVMNHFLFENLTRVPDTETKKMEYKCPHCHATFIKLLGLKVHLIKFHHLSCVRRLEELQKDSLILKKLPKIRKYFPCKCGDYFKGIKLFKLHRKKFCNLNGDLVETSSKLVRDPLKSEVDVEEFQAEHHFNDAEVRHSPDIGDLKPRVNIKTDIGEEEIGGPERKRKRSELDSDSDSSSSERKLAIPKRNS